METGEPGLLRAQGDLQVNASEGRALRGEGSGGGRRPLPRGAESLSVPGEGNQPIESGCARNTISGAGLLLAMPF